VKLTTKSTGSFDTLQDRETEAEVRNPALAIPKLHVTMKLARNHIFTLLHFILIDI
jgi:hypothetical protein